MSARGQLDGKLAQNATSAGMAVDRDGFGYRQPGMQSQESLSEADFFSLSIESSAYLRTAKYPGRSFTIPTNRR